MKPSSTKELIPEFEKIYLEIEQLSQQAAVHQKKFEYVTYQIKKFLIHFKKNSSSDEITSDEYSAYQAVMSFLNEFIQLFCLYQPNVWAQTTLEDPCSSVPSQLTEISKKLQEAAVILDPEGSKSFDFDITKWINLHILDLNAISASFNQYIQTSNQKDEEIVLLMNQRLRSLNAFLSQYEDDPDKILSQGNKVFSPIPINYQSWRLKSDDLEEIKEIGSGISANVFYGIDKRNGKKVAIKKLKFDKLTGMKLQSFQREISILSSVSHPSLLGFVGATDEPPYCIVTEWMSNGNLYQELHKFKRMNQTLRAIAAFDIARGMQYLHSNHIIHRDLKSLNILIDSKGHAHICDFGFSRKDDEDEMMTKNVGTPHWMAPELLSGSGCYSSKIDVYAYGILLWEIATGSIPYQGIDPNQVVAQVMMNDLRPIIPSYIDQNLKELIKLCWNKDPDKRPPFSEIIKIFKTGKIIFSGADMDSFIKYMNEVDDNEKNEMDEFEKRTDNDDDIEELIQNIEKNGLSSDLYEKYWNAIEKCKNPNLTARGLICFLKTPMKLKASYLLRMLPCGSIPLKAAISIGEMIPSDSNEFDDNLVLAACKNGAADTVLVLAVSPRHIKIALEVVSRQGVDILLKSAVADRCFQFLNSDDESLVCYAIRCLFGICEQRRITIQSIQKHLNTNNIGLKNCLFLSIAYLVDTDQVIISELSEITDFLLNNIEENPVSEVSILAICSKSPQLSLHLVNRFIQEKRNYHEVLTKILIIISKDKILHDALLDMINLLDYQEPVFLQKVQKIRNYILKCKKSIDK